MRARAAIASALALGLCTASGARAAEATPPQRLTFVGAAYGFSLDHDGFSLNTTVIRFLTRGTLENVDVLETLRFSARTGATLGVEIDPSQGDVDEKSLRATFPALHIITRGENLNIARGPDPGVPTPRGMLAEGVALAEAHRDSAALPFIEQAIADPTLSPRLKSLAYRLRGQLRFRSATGFPGKPTPEGDRARVAGLDDLDRAASLAPDDAETALVRSEFLASLGANEEALAGLRPSPDPERDFTRITLAARLLMQMGRFSEALSAVDDVRRLYPTALGMAYHYNRGQALLGLGRYQDAIGDFTEGLKTQPGYSSAYFERACAQAKLGRLEDARKDVENAANAMGPSFKARPQAERAAWLDQTMTKLVADVRKDAGGPGPCLDEPRARSPLLDQRASAVKGSKPAP